ncbi:MAG: DUF5723 family protein [Bacteroidales bacterium]
MKAKKIMMLLLLTAVTGSIAEAQTSNVLYYMNLPQRTSLNPALQPSGRTYVGLPGISDISVRVDNNFLSLSDMFSNGVISDSTFTILNRSEDLDNFIAGLGNNNSLEPQAAVQLFGLAFTVGDDLRISFDITERADANFVLPGDLIRLGIQGNESYIGRNIDMSSMRADMKYYHEMGLGASKNITEKLRVGARLMFLSGVASAYLTNNGMTLTVNEDNTHTLDADVSLNLSAPVIFTRDETDGTIDNIRFDEDRFNEGNDYLSYGLGFANPGLGIELGAEYRFNELFAVSAALTDIGFINWKRDRSEVYITKTFEFNGLTMQDVYDESVSFSELTNWAADSLQKSIELNESPGSYTTYLPFNMTAGFSFTPADFFTAGLLSQTRFEGKQVHEALTLSGNINLGNALSTTLAWTVANRRYDNLGFGLAFRGGFFQFYAIVDNIPLQYTRVTSGTESYTIPENWNTVHARLGINFVFGNREKEKIPAVF